MYIIQGIPKIRMPHIRAQIWQQRIDILALVEPSHDHPCREIMSPFIIAGKPAMTEGYASLPPAAPGLQLEPLDAIPAALWMFKEVFPVWDPQLYQAVVPGA